MIGQHQRGASTACEELPLIDAGGGQLGLERLGRAIESLLVGRRCGCNTRLSGLAVLEAVYISLRPDPAQIAEAFAVPATDCVWLYFPANIRESCRGC